MKVTKKVISEITAKDLQELIATGRHLTELNDGDIIEIDGIDHVIIGRDVEDGFKHSMTLQRHNKIFERRFDTRSNRYEISEIRRYLNGTYRDSLPVDFTEIVSPVTIDGMKEQDYFFLLSSDDLDMVHSKYPYYHERENRIHFDESGYPEPYWLRDPSTGNSYLVRGCGEDGGIGYSGAGNTGRGLAPACIVGTI